MSSKAAHLVSSESDCLNSGIIWFLNSVEHPVDTVSTTGFFLSTTNCTIISMQSENTQM